MYYSDLIKYTYITDMPPALDGIASQALNVGWLQFGNPFTQGNVTSEFIARLWEFCKAPVHLTLGIHDCDLCQPPTTIYRVRRNDETAFLGTAEIRVFGADGKVYAAPTLIYHYVVDHGYLPPAEFIQAVLMGVPPNTPECQALINGFEDEGD